MKPLPAFGATARMSTMTLILSLVGLLVGMAISACGVLGDSEDPSQVSGTPWACTGPDDAALLADLLLITTITAQELALATAFLMEVRKSAPVMPEIFAERSDGITHAVRYVQIPGVLERENVESHVLSPVAADLLLGLFSVHDSFRAFKEDVVQFQHEDVSLPSEGGEHMFAAAEQFVEAEMALIDRCWPE